MDSSEGHPEECDYCNIFPEAWHLLWELFEEARNSFTEIEQEERLEILQFKDAT